MLKISGGSLIVMKRSDNKMVTTRIYHLVCSTTCHIFNWYQKLSRVSIPRIGISTH